MNKKVVIEVKTPVGMSNTESVKEIVSQGSPQAALISSANVSIGVKEAFKDSKKEIEYHNVHINPQRNMNDIICPAETRKNKLSFAMISFELNIFKIYLV